MTADTAHEQSAALSAVEDSAAPAAAAGTAPADPSKLGAAVSNLSLDDKKQAAAPPKPVNVKIDAADIAYLVEQLEVPKARATELLKKNAGDRVAALREFVLPVAA
ncbi:hypothetical protein FH972_021176 [Carpinus fangiana]|uniref:Nascent polypeptide-associated complex subunit alpha-like UBA domain-containing protein n=1 Tax=Carpinus fangiana TaxID=176857 RepID=A0A5N6KNL0_9ROSI|nr:hypothetical protein FH972_021176 [Carpinus fangiana]